MTEVVPSMGRIVHYSDRQGRIRPAIITNVFVDEGERVVDLIVFDEEVPPTGTYAVFSVKQWAKEKSPFDRWDWPPRDA